VILEFQWKIGKILENGWKFIGKSLESGWKVFIFVLVKRTISNI
jgi:hypothetical protein